MDGWKMSFLLGFPIFRGYVKIMLNVGGVIIGGSKTWFLRLAKNTMGVGALPTKKKRDPLLAIESWLG